ncbi:MAG: peptide deformylase [Clostridia bacterium]|nr:peptide deformylase [Clostridia bacterium]
MAIRKVVLYGDDILRKRSREVDKFDERLHQLLDDMAETMYQQNGAGLAAVQIGILKRVITIDAGQGLIELVNPVIVETSGMQNGPEGCLSIPEKFVDIKRPYKVKVRAFDRHGKPFTMEGTELLARAFCHEIDHLEGKLFIDLIEK